MVSASAELELRLIARDEMSKVFKGVQKEASGFSKVLGDVSKVAGGFIAANVISGAAAKITGFLGDSTQAASDLGESINAVNKIFGTSASTILAWGDDQANAFGLSQRAFNQLATPMGAALKNMGFAQDEVAKQTINLTERAADMASVFNTTVPDALEAINSALRGEANPIERYGVSVNAAKVEAEAFAMTGKTVASSLTDQEKASARLSLIFAQTNDVAGDFKQTSDQNANAARIASAKYEEMQVILGEKLLPIQLKVTQAKMAFIDFMVAKGIPTLEALYAKHWPAISSAIDDVAQFISDLTPVWSFMAEHAIAKIQGTIQVVSGIAEVVSRFVAGVKAVFDGDWRTAWDEFSGIPSAALDVMLGLITSQLGALPRLFYEAGWDAIQGLLDGLKMKWNDIKSWFSNAVDDIPGTFKRLLGISSPSKVMHGLGEETMQGYANGLISRSAAVYGILDDVSRHLQLGVAEGPNPHLQLGGGSIDHGWAGPGRNYGMGYAGESGGGGGKGGGSFSPAAYRGSTVVNVNVAGSIVSENDLNSIVRNAISNGGYRGVI